MTRLLTFLCAALWLASTVHAADGYGLMGTNIPQPHASWQLYTAGDAPEGGWRGVDTALAITAGVITCPFTIPAGTNYFLFKAISYCGSNVFRVISGGNSNSVGLNDSDWNRYWTLPIPVVVPHATNAFTLQPIVESDICGAVNTRFILRGFYVTTNYYENVGAAGIDYIVDYEWPTNTDNSTPVAGNLIENGGFEVGMNHGWGLKLDSGARDVALWTLWDTNDFHTGKSCIHIPADSGMAWGNFHATLYQPTLVSKPFRLRTNSVHKQHTISLWTKGATNENGLLTVRSIASAPSGSGYSNSFSVTTNISAGASWHRTAITTNFAIYPTEDFQIEIRVPVNTRIDSVMLCEGTNANYIPFSTVEIGVVSGRTGNLFLDTDTVELPVYGWSSNANAHVVNWLVRDWLNNSVTSGVVNLSLAAETLGRATISNPAAGRIGSFRMLSWLSGQANTAEETLFTVLRAIPASVTNLYAGTHAAPGTYQGQVMFDSGMRTVRGMSTFQAWNPQKAEAVDDVFVRFDADVNKFHDAEVQIMATLYANGLSDIPVFMQDVALGNLFKTNEWAEFVNSNVTYYSTINLWEHMNEPLYFIETNLYATYSIQSAAKIRAANPSARIIGMGGVHDDEWVKRVLQIMGTPYWTNYMDVIATHLYPTDVDPSGGNTPAKAWQWKTNIIDPYGAEVWNTEAGIKELGAATFNANYLSPGYALWPHLDSERHQISHYFAELSLKNALICFAFGQKKYFYYDSRLASDPSFLEPQFTSLDYDDSLKPKHVALSSLNALIGTADGHGQVTNGLATIFLFKENTNTWLSIWASNGLPGTITFATNNLTAFDTMGNTLAFTTPSQTLRYGRKPLYVKCSGADTNRLRTLAATALVTNSLADTTPPNISIDVAPHGVASGTTVYFRWVAFDDASVPSEVDPFVIQYQTKLDDGAWSGWSAYHFRTITGVDSSQHTFYVAAKDAAGNAVTNSLTFNAQSASNHGQSLTTRGRMLNF